MWMGRWDLILVSGSGRRVGRELGRRMGWCFQSEGGQRTDVVGLSEVVASAGFWLCCEERRTGRSACATERLRTPARGRRELAIVLGRCVGTGRNACATERLRPVEPCRLEFGWMLEGLHHDAELFGFFLQGVELVGGCVWSGDVEIQADAFKAYRNVL